MVDKFTAEKRSEIMSKIKGKNTKIEIKVRKYLFSKGFRYRKNDKRYPGTPDLVLPKYKTAVFINGCFWHGHENCKLYRLPKSNVEFWQKKIERNQTNDLLNRTKLEEMGFQVIVIWECELRRSFDDCMFNLVQKIKTYGEDNVLNNNDANLDYSSPDSIENFGKHLIGKTFSEICNLVVQEDIELYGSNHTNVKDKGGLGQIIERIYFGLESGNFSGPDFEQAGVELKVTPYRINKNGTLAAKERLIINMIDYFAVIDEEFETSHLWNKVRLMLLVFYLYQKEVENRLDYKINYVSLFSPPEKDLQIIKSDFIKIVEKIKSGKAHELSEGDTLYLGAAPKGATSSDRRAQPCNDELAKPRAFAFKNSYMTFILNNYIVTRKKTYETILKAPIEVTFEEYITEKINSYNGYSIEDLIKEFNVKYKNRPKNIGSILVYKILGIKGNHAEEFEKAGIVIKTIRLSNKNRIKESMSFPTFKFKELIEEEWENSKFGNYLSETRFLFIVFKYDENEVLRLKGCQFWNIPYKDLNDEVYEVWNKTKTVLKEGLEVKKINGRNYNNLPNASENRVCHVRPHARNSSDTYDLPDGRQYPKQCFWLNNNYILDQLDDKFFT